MRDVDYALVGGGLQNSLIALALRARHPDARIVLVERGATLGGNHTWCFHAGDLAADVAAWIAPAIVARWSGYDVVFPALSRTLESQYACVTSASLAAAVESALAGCELRLSTAAISFSGNGIAVRAADGAVTEYSARTVIDARGPDCFDAGAAGWQKFVGQELRTATPHGLTRPILMDATVPQREAAVREPIAGAFRFMYVLPLASDRLLVEDTYFSDSTHLDVAASRAEIAAYATARGWMPAAIEREETGVLPLPWRAEPPRPPRDENAPHAGSHGGEPLVAGYAGGWFHPVTGYSFPIAARLAIAIADGRVGELARSHASQFRFALRLNHMLFRWFAPEQRYRVLERFYRLPEATVRRFYALDMTLGDRARLLVGRPPRGLSMRRMFGGSREVVAVRAGGVQ